ncbi:hypothetical protein N474_14935 [Pseudoalteromonas luteoviolacea CPMOR-2]|uniref:Uncharacterized protein n=1 Tax=Pseudoalteromonas luteoviolacea DSM 6061 TaxID=1365250 RepID=A0A166X730_9GAMM|nr:hypothetical protein [Pseudoalteromonas luteoviolacea]KZN39749.1 hypothetical protein N475_13395 [Pseudoalteromonas luteoviolacea DSM 6061]KZN55278.1 hypothetical protein N474_14935 [Pseudoalteromonas luteoviolacea CPMOR-2]
MMIAVYGIEAQLNPIKARLSNIIQATLTQVIGLPEDKRAQRSRLKNIMNLL